MNILYDMQLSVLTSLDDGKFILERDSNFNVMCAIISRWSVLHPEDNFYVLYPHGWQIDGLKEGDAYPFFGKALSNVQMLSYDYFGNPFMDRMTFDAKELNKAIGDVRIDAVFTNDPCKVLAYKTFFYYKQKKFVPVVSRNHWVSGETNRKVPAEIDFDIRQVEGALMGDGMSFNSEYAKEQFVSNAASVFGNEIELDLANKLMSIEMVDIQKLDEHKTEERYDVFTILWGHRLSYYTGWQETFDALNSLWEKRKDFQVIIPDPGNKFTQSELKEKYPFMLEIDKATWTHADYLRACWMSDICIGNHKYPATWGGLAITEPMAAYTVPIMPNSWAYPEMMWSRPEYPIFFNDEEEMISLIEGYMDSPMALEKMKKSARQFCEQHLNPDKFAESLYNVVKLAVQEYDNN